MDPRVKPGGDAEGASARFNGRPYCIAARSTWIPAFAGMTVGGFGPLDFATRI